MVSSALVVWTILFTAAALFGLMCIKWGTYTSGDRGERPTLDI